MSDNDVKDTGNEIMKTILKKERMCFYKRLFYSTFNMNLNISLINL